MSVIQLELTKKQWEIYEEVMKRLMKQQFFLLDCPMRNGWTG